MFNFNVNNGMEEHAYFSGKKLEELTIEELAYIHLKPAPGRVTLKNCHLSSGLYNLIETLNVSFNNNRTNQYVPLMTSFAILDQLGALYSLKNKNSRFGNGIKKCLDCFSSLTDLEIENLYSLRNGVLHDGSLTNIARQPNGAKVIFRLNKNAQSMITHPKVPWDGVYRDKLVDSTSHLNLKLFKDMILRIYTDHFNELKSGNLLISSTSPEQLYYKYLFAAIKKDSFNV